MFKKRSVPGILLANFSELCKGIKPCNSYCCYYYNYAQQQLIKPYSIPSFAAPQFGPMNSAQESDVGIFCYISHLPGFRGILKQRYSDFIVNEVDLDGNVVHLTSLEASPEIAEKKEEKTSEQSNKNYDNEIESFRALAGDCDAELLKAFIDQISSGVEKKIEPIVLSPSSDKSHRTAIHNFFKENLKFLVTDTIDGPEISLKCIRVRLDSGGNSGRDRSSRKRKERGDKPYDSRGSDCWPEHLGKFLRFHLYKENKDTQEAIGLIGKMLGIQPRSFGFAGTKDKRSVSTQMVTVFKQRASRLAALNGRLIGITVGDFCHVKEGLLLGQLHGNQFTITLRGVAAESTDTIKASVDALGRHGFINYFGLQRFGSSSVPTHHIGANLLRGEWKTAVSMILDPKEGEKDATRKAREYYKETDDVDGTLRQLPRHLVAERAILQCLKKCHGNYLQALKAIPRTLRMMYVHSYQSYLWNHAASTRVQKYGTDQVVVGDLVYCRGGNTEKVIEISSSECMDSDCSDDYSNLDEISDNPVCEERSIPVKIVNEEDLVSGNYTLDDVVLPLPGSRVIYPVNDVGKVYDDLAMKDGISLTETVHNVKEFSIICLTGGYRRVFQKLKDFKWELLTYTNANIPLAETDLDRVAKSRPTAMVRKESVDCSMDENSSNDCRKQSAIDENDDKLSNGSGKKFGLQQKEFPDGNGVQGAQTALKLTFTLPTSCYATMAIRELLKTSTSVAFHKTLNQ